MVTVLTMAHRGSTDAELLEALRAREPLALAEAYHRTINATHAAARRLLGVNASAEVEAVLHQLYTELWQNPPVEQPLEGWLRRRGFALAEEHLRSEGRSAATPSTAALLPELGMPEPRALEPGEQVLAELDEPARLAFVRAHDAGMATADQGDPEAEAALNRALQSLAGAAEDAEGAPRERAVIPLLADWSLGLVAPAPAAEMTAAMADRPSWGARARMLRRGRRRLEGLPPHPDMGQRILVAILADDRNPGEFASPRQRIVDLTDEGGEDGEDVTLEPESTAEEGEDEGQNRRRRGGGLLTRLRGGVLLAVVVCFVPALSWAAWRR